MRGRIAVEFDSGHRGELEDLYKENVATRRREYV